jgi:hypothetical protein
LQDQIGHVVLLLQTVPLGVQRDQSIAVRLDDLSKPLVQIHEEGVVHGLERHPEEATFGFGFGAGLLACPAPDNHQDQRDGHQTSIHLGTPLLHVDLLSVPPFALLHCL